MRWSFQWESLRASPSVEMRDVSTNLKLTVRERIKKRQETVSGWRDFLYSDRDSPTTCLIFNGWFFN